MKNYEEFKNEVRRYILVFMPQEYKNARVEIIEVNKNNGLKLDGLVIRNEDQTVMPNLYLQGYYEEYQNGRRMDDVMKEISNTYLSAIKEAPLAKMNDMEFEKIKDNIIFTVINTKLNAEMLKDMPHIEKHDLSIVFRWLASKDENGLATALLYDNHIKNWGLTTEQLYEIAVKNTEEKFPLSFRSMEQVMMEIMGKDMGDMFLDMDISGEDARQMFESEGSASMYVLSNQSNINGSAAMFYPDSLQTIADKLENNFYVLPSSTHEVIIVPETENITIPNLADMVRDVNATQVPEGELLSGSIYRYDREQQELSVVGGHEVEIKQEKQFTSVENNEYEMEY